MSSAPPPGYYPQDAYYAPGWGAPSGDAQHDHDRALRRRRNRLVLVTMGGALAGALLVGGLLGLRYWMDVRPVGEIDAPREVTARQLDVGHCLEDLPDDGEVSRVRLVPCDQPHAAEVIGSVALRGDGWPGRRTVDERAGAACEMDNAQQAAGLRPVVWAPSAAAWAQGDRTALCLAWSAGGAVTGSFTAGDEVVTG